MYQVIDAIDVLISDLHLTLGPLLGAAPPLRPEWSFLTDPALYAAKYEEHAQFETAHFTVRSLPSLKRHRFWGHYRRMPWDPWHLQLPFEARPKAAKVLLDPGPPWAPIRVAPSLLVRPSGWSSHLDLAFDRPTSHGELTALIGGIRSADPPAFVRDGGRTTFRGLFKWMADRLKADLFTGGEPWDLPQIWQHFVISVAGNEGEARPYHPKKKLPGRPGLDLGEKALVFSFLWGHPVSEGDVGAEEADGFILTDLWHADFGVSRFGLEKMGDSTLLSLSDSLSSGKSHRSLSCLAMNVRSCWIQVFCLDRLLRKTADMKNVTPALEDLRTAAAQILPLLGETYTNAFCQDLFRKHRDLKRYRAAEGAPAG